MHSKIYQVGLKPMSEDDYVNEEHFLESSSSYADYIGDALEGEERKECIKNLAESLKEIFDYNEEEEALVYKGMGTFIHDWYEDIKAEVNCLNENEVHGIVLARIRNATRQTHLRLCSRFYIENWNDAADPLAELIEYVSWKMEVGDKLYIGNVIDFHW